MSFLMKSCKADHHLKKADSIRIGTLGYFRKHPDPEVGDDLEAALSTRVEIRSPSVFPSQVLTAILPQGIDFGDNAKILRRPHQMYLNHYHINKVVRGQVHIERYDCRYVTEGSDALIFCMTLVKDQASDPRLGYSSSWKMRRSSAERFGKKLLAELNGKFRDEPVYFLGEDHEENGVDPNAVSFTLHHAPVKYRARNVHLVDPSLTELRKLGHLLKNSDMVKTLNYVDQDEYRFCFRLLHKDTLVKLRSDLEHVDINASFFRRYTL
ncbi:hypothetical protein [Leisingera sp. MMG026]|uniref:hypothetical protein n=1 Tax=Leisingera sp. MMG026 TaxID=2909982 RepID=UPI001F3FDA10|nr:hypothetical protein [Leisingera sp. MMG026]MCF6432646.1 hypothetical protein [Leisingera sp. MMG026]